MHVLVLDHIHHAAIDLLRQHVEVTHLPQPPSSDLLAEIISHFQALIMRVTPHIDHRVLERAKNLQVIGVASVGLDHIDLAAADEAGIRVVNQPGVNRDSVAEFTFGLILCLTRMIPQASQQLKAGVWSRNEYQHGIELRGRTLGIVGFGQTGSRVAEIAQGFRMRILSYSPYTPDRRVKDRSIHMVDLDELLSESDIISVHCPLTPQTKNMIGPRELSLMRPGAYLLNLARGGIVDESALYEALRIGHLAGAAADVFALEPPGHSPLLRLPNFVGTPHIAGPTRDSLWRAGVGAAELVLSHLCASAPAETAYLAAQA